MTGVLAFAAGLVLTGLAAAILWLHRRPGSRRVWVQRALAPIAVFVGALHWNLPDVSHTAALRQAPEPYEKRVTAFFDRTLR